MGKCISVIDDKPDARKHGLRIKVQGVEVDDNNNITRILCDYSQYHEIGSFILCASKFNPIPLDKEVQNG